MAPLGVQTESPVPRPWSKEARERVYFYHSNGIVMHYTESRWAHQKKQEAIAGEARVNETFRRLVRDGMTFNELGLDLTLLQHVRHRGDPKAVLQDEDALASDVVASPPSSPTGQRQAEPVESSAVVPKTSPTPSPTSTPPSTSSPFSPCISPSPLCSELPSLSRCSILPSFSADV